MIKGGAMIFVLIPATFIVVTILVTLASKKSKGSWLLALAAGVMAGGVVTAGVEFFCLVGLLFKGTDGPGGLIAIILPMVTVMAATGVSVVLTTVGGFASVVKASKKSTILSAEAQAILNAHPNFILPNKSLPPGSTWRDFARAAKP